MHSRLPCSSPNILRASRFTPAHGERLRNFMRLRLPGARFPIKIIVGDRDEYFSMAAVRRTGDALKEASFPAEIDIVPGQHHGFIPETATGTEESAWRFLAPITLLAAPVFMQYPQLQR